MDELADGFNASQEQYHLTWEYHGPVMEFSKRLAIGITQNQLPDMVIIDNPDMPSYVSMDKLEDITEAVKEIEDLDQYFPNAMESVEYEGRYYGLPFCCNNVALIYNKDILEQKKIAVPENWEQLETAAGSLTEEGRYGFAMSVSGSRVLSSLLLLCCQPVMSWTGQAGKGQKGHFSSYRIWWNRA